MDLISKLSFLLLLSLVALASAAGYGNENAPKPKLPTPYYHHPFTPKELAEPFTIAVQGIVYCKSGPKLTPLEGNFILI